MAETYGTQCCFVSLLEAPASLLAVIWHDISRTPAAPARTHTLALTHTHSHTHMHSHTRTCTHTHASTQPRSTFPGPAKKLFLGWFFFRMCTTDVIVNVSLLAAHSHSLSLSLFLSFFLSFLSSNTHKLHFFSEAL